MSKLSKIEDKLSNLLQRVKYSGHRLSNCNQKKIHQQIMKLLRIRSKMGLRTRSMGVERFYPKKDTNSPNCN